MGQRLLTDSPELGPGWHLKYVYFKYCRGDCFLVISGSAVTLSIEPTADMRPRPKGMNSCLKGQVCHAARSRQSGMPVARDLPKHGAVLGLGAFHKPQRD